MTWEILQSSFQTIYKIMLGKNKPAKKKIDFNLPFDYILQDLMCMQIYEIIANLTFAICKKVLP